MSRALPLILIFVGGIASANPYESFARIEDFIAQGKLEEAAKELGSLPDSRFQDRKLYLSAWIGYRSGQYEASLRSLKRLLSLGIKNDYYYPALLLSARVSEVSGHRDQAVKLVQWIGEKKPSDPGILLLTAIYARQWGVPQNPRFLPGVEFLIWESLLKEPAQTKSEEPPKKLEKREAASLNPGIHFQSFLNTDESLLGKQEAVSSDGIEKEQKTEKTTKGAKELEALRLDLKAKRKELEILQILLDEKKRLLYLKEQYLNDREKALKDAGR